MALNLYDLFRQTARGQPRQPAILSANAEPLSYGALDEAIQGAGRGLRQAGVRPGDCFGLHLASGVDYIVGNYAVWSCGACVVPMPMELRPNEKHEIARVIALDWIISWSDTASLLEPLRPGRPTMISQR